MYVRNIFAAMMKPDLTTLLVVSLVAISLAIAGPIAGAIGFGLFTAYAITLSMPKRYFVSAAIFLASGAVVTIVCLSGSAWADTAPAQSAGTFSLAPLINLLGPSIGEILVWLVGTVLGLLIGLLVKLLQHFNIQVDTARFDVIKASAAKIVWAWWTTKSAAIAVQTFSSTDKTVLILADLVKSDVLPFVNKLGLTRDQLAVFVQAEIGKLQTAILPSLGSAAVVAPNPPPASTK